MDWRQPCFRRFKKRIPYPGVLFLLLGDTASSEDSVRQAEARQGCLAILHSYAGFSSSLSNLIMLALLFILAEGAGVFVWLDKHLDWAKRVNIYKKLYCGENGLLLKGCAALNKLIHTPEGLAEFLAAQELGQFILGFSALYEEKLKKLTKYDDLLHVESLGDSEKTILSALWNLKNEPTLQEALVITYNSLITPEDREKFKEEYYKIFRSTYKLLDEPIFAPQREVW